jgi:hypothetical protein
LIELFPAARTTEETVKEMRAFAANLPALV